MVVNMINAWEKNIRKIEPYVPGEQPDEKDMIKLNTNENPYPPSTYVAKRMQELGAQDTDKLRLYPDPDSTELREVLSDFYGVKQNQIFVGVGSDDVLALAFLTFFNSDKEILFPDITYSFYDVWADLYRIPYKRPALDENFRIKAKDYYQENGGVVIANPNAPTGIYEDLDFIRDILEHNRDCVVIVDEAYIDFGGQSALPLLKEYGNLLIVQTFSKSRSMAGMRIGFAMGNPELIASLQAVRGSFNSYPMTRLTTLLGVESVKDEEYFRKTTEKIIETREWAKKEFTRLGFHFPDSATNFLFVSHDKTDAKKIFEKLKEKNIYVRHFGAERIDNYLRITIGRREEMEMLFKELEAIVNH